MRTVHAKKLIKKTWNFLVHDDSWASFIADAILILIIGKFILFPAIGLILGNSFPIVAVVSGSMDHNSMDLDEWWINNGEYYNNFNIDKQDFEEFYLTNGFEKGDVLVIKGVSIDKLEVGDIIVYSAPNRKDPIIHRIISTNPISTKGDANFGQISFEKNISPNQIHGKAIVLAPYIGWVKVGIMDLLGMI